MYPVARNSKSLSIAHRQMIKTNGGAALVGPPCDSVQLVEAQGIKECLKRERD